MSFTLNFNNASAPTPRDPIPRGEYDFVIDDAVIGETKNGADSITLWLKVEMGSEFDGRIVFDTWTIPDEIHHKPESIPWMLGFLQEKLQAIYGEAIEGDYTIDADDLVGRRVRCEISLERRKNLEVLDADGKPTYFDPQNSVKKYIGLGGLLLGSTASAPQPYTPQIPGASPAVPPPNPTSPTQYMPPVPAPSPVTPAAPAPSPASVSVPEQSTPAPTEAPAEAPAPPETNGESAAAPAFRL